MRRAYGLDDDESESGNFFSFLQLFAMRNYLIDNLAVFFCWLDTFSLFSCPLQLARRQKKKAITKKKKHSSFFILSQYRTYRMLLLAEAKTMNDFLLF